MKKKRSKSPIFLEKYWEIIPRTRVRFDFPRLHQKFSEAKRPRFFTYYLFTLHSNLSIFSREELTFIVIDKTHKM